MKLPKYAALTPQQQVDGGLNAWAITLLAESFAHKREMWGEESVCVQGWGKDEKPVFIVLSSKPPQPDPEVVLAGDIDKAREIIAGLCVGGADAWRMSIPPQPDDCDMLLSRLLDRLEHLETEAVRNRLEKSPESGWKENHA